MTYIAGGSIQATDFNSFVSQINEVFADSNSGSVVAPPADFGYGHPALSSVAIGQNVGAAEWTSLFSTIKDIGTHQGTVLDTSGIPALVNAGNIIYAITALQQVVNDARASRLSIDASQIAMIPLFSPSQPSYSAPQWTTGIEFVYTVDFGSWNNARHFFNLGGAIGMVGSIPDGAPLTANHFWHDMLVNAGVIKMDHTSTSSNGVATGTIGFYDLTTSYQEIYRKTPTGGGYYYNGSYMNIRAKLNAAPGTNGIIQFAIGLYDADGTPTGKTGPLVWTINSFQSSGAIPYLGTVTAATVGTGGGGSGTPGFDLVAYSGGGGNPLLTLQMSPTSLSDTITGAGTANAGPITCTVLNGVPPYSFAWTNVTSSPNTATISAPVNTPTTSQVSISKSLNSGDIYSGTIRCTVQDGALQSAYLNANWSFTSNGVPASPFITLTGGNLPLSRVYSNTTYGPNGFLSQTADSFNYVYSAAGINGSWVSGSFTWTGTNSAWGSAASPTRYVTSGYDTIVNESRIYYQNGGVWSIGLIPANTGQDFRIGYGNGLFVAFQTSSTEFYTSTDGISWTQHVNANPATMWYSPVYSTTLGRWVAVSTNGSITSTDGINWTLNPSPPFGSFNVQSNNNALAESNGTFLVIRSASTFAKSTDGINWTEIPVPESTSFATLAGGTGGFVYIPNSTANIYTSYTGASWQLFSNPHGTFYPRGSIVSGSTFICPEDGTNRFVRGVLS